MKDSNNFESQTGALYDEADIAKFFENPDPTKTIIHEDNGIDLNAFDKEVEIAKFKKAVKAVGWTLFVRLYTEPKKTSGGLIMPDKVRDEALYTSCVGLVIQKGKGVYTDDRYRGTGPWCDIGDWILFPRHAGYRIFVYGVPIWVLKEDALDGIVHDPRGVSKYKY